MRNISSIIFSFSWIKKKRACYKFKYNASLIDKQKNKNNKIKRNNSTNNNLPPPSDNNYIRFCPRCQQKLRLIKNRTNNSYFLGCSGFPNCKFTFNINNPGYCELGSNECNKCGNLMYKIGKDENDNFIDICLGNCINENGNCVMNYNSNNNNNGGKRKYNNNNINGGKKKGRRKKKDEDDDDYDGDF